MGYNQVTNAQTPIFTAKICVQLLDHLNYFRWAPKVQRFSSPHPPPPDRRPTPSLPEWKKKRVPFVVLDHRQTHLIQPRDISVELIVLLLFHIGVPIILSDNMKFSTSSVLAVLALAGSAAAFAPSAKHLQRITSSLSMSTEVAEENKKVTKKEKRLKFMKTESFHRRGFKEVREGVEKSMEEQFKSQLVDELTSNDFVIEKDGVKVYLAKDFGFCWGVERSIALAYEAVEHFPGKTVHITNELIHNPEVNDKLHDMDVQFIEKLGEGKKDFSKVNDGDVVILPAFGASFEEMSLMNSKNVDIVDTTCPWVSKVWNTVDQHQRKGLTSVIHGKYAHEETVATVSFAEDYICVKDMKEAEMVADYIINGGDKEAFLKYFEKAVSEGFDPDTMLNKVGLANQTTMYKKETRAIGQLMQKAMMKKFGPVEAKDHYLEFDTICDATQVSSLPN